MASRPTVRSHFGTSVSSTVASCRSSSFVMLGKRTLSTLMVSTVARRASRSTVTVVVYQTTPNTGALSFSVHDTALRPDKVTPSNFSSWGWKSSSVPVPITMALGHSEAAPSVGVAASSGGGGGACAEA